MLPIVRCYRQPKKQQIIIILCHEARTCMQYISYYQLYACSFVTGRFSFLDEVDAAGAGDEEEE